MGNSCECLPNGGERRSQAGVIDIPRQETGDVEKKKRPSIRKRSSVESKPDFPNFKVEKDMYFDGNTLNQ